MFLRSSFFIGLLGLVLSSCTSTTHLSVRKLPLDSGSYASTFAKTPDPVGNQGKKGERLYVDWKIPYQMDPSDYEVILSIIYKDLSEERVVIPLKARSGGFNFPLADKRLEETKGFLTYKVDLVDKSGNVADSWQQAMWVKVIR